MCTKMLSNYWPYMNLLNHINPIYIDDLLDEDRHSFFVIEDKYEILIVRGIVISDDGLEFLSKGIILNKLGDLFYYDKDKNSLVEYKYKEDHLFEIINPIYERNQTIIESYIKEIDKIEDSIYEHNTSRIFVGVWFDLKKDMSRIERHLVRNYGVLNRFFKYKENDKKFQVHEFRSLLEQIQINHGAASAQLHRLDTLYNYYSSIKNDKLNKNIYVLTLLSAVFLPLNLVVGFFGMNTENLYFKNNPMGTQYVLNIIILSLAISIFGLPLIRFLDHHILKIFLGRYDIYKKISQKIDRIFSLE